jgi:hypothetical protein
VLHKWFNTFRVCNVHNVGILQIDFPLDFKTLFAKKAARSLSRQQQEIVEQKDVQLLVVNDDWTFFHQAP